MILGFNLLLLGEIAEALAVACLNQPEFVTKNLIPVNTLRGNAELRGRKVGEFYQAIYKVVRETPKVTSPRGIQHD